MERLVNVFEKEVRAKVQHKADSYKQEELLLLRTFRYFDYADENKVDFTQFLKVMQRLSVSSFSNNDLKQIFDFYISKESSNVYVHSIRSQKLNFLVFVNKILNMTNRKKSSDTGPSISRREKSNKEQGGLVSSKQFERALVDFKEGIKKLDMILILKKIMTTSENMSEIELDQRNLLGLFMNAGMAVRLQVYLLNSIFQDVL